MLFDKAQPYDITGIERCLSARQHVLVFAQSWLSREPLEKLTAVAKQSQVQLVLVNPDRFLPSRQLLRQQLDSGKLGVPGLVRIRRWEPETLHGTITSSQWPTPFLRDLDLALWYGGKPPNVLFAVQPTAAAAPSTGTYLQVHLGFPDGGMSLIDYASCLPAGDDYTSLSIIGSAGAAYADDHQNMQLLYGGGRPQALRSEERSRQLFFAVVQDFVDGLTAGRDFSCGAKEWLETLSIAECVQRSCESRQAIVLGGI